ncbi:MAG: exonuclease SbcCD subunit D [Caldilineaceae bacterium]
MKAKFMHIADCHLGYWQYHLKERYNDFATVYMAALDVAIAEQVDFVLLAGDLFEKRSIDALTLNQAISGLEKLQRAGIPCLAVEGNHEHAYYRDTLGWMDFLAVRKLLMLLDAKFDDGELVVEPYGPRGGAYYEPLKGLRVYGLRYLGAGAPAALSKYAEALAAVPKEGIEYAIFMTHGGIEGEVSDLMGGLKHSQLTPLRTNVDYIALGHIHKPYEHDGWIYNPGSLETCSISETQWPERGYYLVEVDTDHPDEAGSKHRACLHTLPRRRFYRFSRKMDGFTSPDEFYEHLREFLERKARDVGARRLSKQDAPVVEVQLTGILPFDRTDLDLAEVEAIVESTFSPLLALVRNLASSAEYAVETGESMSRVDLERRVMEDLFARDVRFRQQSEQWASAALELKRLALEGALPEAILDELESRMGAIRADGGEILTAEYEEQTETEAQE